MIRYCIIIICALSSVLNAKEITGAFGIRFGETITGIRYIKVPYTQNQYRARSINTKYRNFNKVYVYADKQNKIAAIVAVFTGKTEQEAKNEQKIAIASLKEKYEQEAEEIIDGFSAFTIKLINAHIRVTRNQKTISILYSYIQPISPPIDNSEKIKEEVKRSSKAAL